MQRDFIHANPNFHMQIRLSQQSPRHRTISRILMHSHIFTKASLPPHVVLVSSTCGSLLLHVSLVARGDNAINAAFCMLALICTFYHRESVETIKMDASGAFGCCRLCGCSVAWMREVNAFSTLDLRYEPIQSFLGTDVDSGSEIWTGFTSPPLSLPHMSLSRHWTWSDHRQVCDKSKD